MEIDIKNLSVAHQKEKVINIFDDPDECLKFADEFEKKYGIKLSCDPLESFLYTVETVGEIKGIKNCMREKYV